MLVDVESLGDVVAQELVPVAQRAKEQEISGSDVTGELLGQASESVHLAVMAAFQSVVDEDQRAAQEVLVQRDEFWRLSERVMRRQAERLALDDADRLLKHRLQTDMVDKLRRIYSISEHLSSTVLPVKVVAKGFEAQA